MIKHISYLIALVLISSCGTNSLPINLCKTSGPSGFDGSLGTIGPNVNYCSCTNDCSGSINLDELSQIQDRELVKILDLSGREVEIRPNAVLIYVYSDGTVERMLLIE